MNGARRTRQTLQILALFFLSLLTVSAAASGEGLPVQPGTHRTEAFRTAPIFSDGMVLPSGRAVTIWGWGVAGEKVTVSIARQQRIRLSDETPIRAIADPSLEMIKVFAHKATKTSVPVSKVKTIKSLCAAFTVVRIVFFQSYHSAGAVTLNPAGETLF